MAGTEQEARRREFPRRTESLAEIFGFIEAFFQERQLDPELLFAVNFTVEELFTNMVKYNPQGSGDIGLSLSCTREGVAVRLTDHADKPFDVTRGPAVDIDQPLEERRPGGLGLHLIRQMVDRIDYEYRDGCSTISFVKKSGV